MPVRELLLRMDARELAEWEVFYRLDPWGEQRADLRNGILCALVAAFAGAKKPPKPKDFMTHPDPEPPRAAQPGPIARLAARVWNRRKHMEKCRGHDR